MTSDPIARYLSQRTAKMDRRNRLRVMSGYEVVDVAIRVYHALGWTFLKLSVVPSLFCLAAFSFFRIYVWPSYFVTKSADSISAQIAEMFSTTGLALFVAAPLFLLGASYTSVVVTRLVSDYMVGNEPSTQAAESRGRDLLPRLFWLNLREIVLAFGGILISLGLLALSAYISVVTAQTDVTAGVVVLVAWIGFAVGAGMFVMVISRHALAPAVMTLEDSGSVASGKRSHELLRKFGSNPSGTGIVWGLCGLLFLLAFMVYFGVSMSLDAVNVSGLLRTSVSGLPFAPVFAQAVELMPAFFVVWTLVPVWATATTIIYYDRRIRLEGYDIEALAEDVWRANRSRRFDV